MERDYMLEPVLASYGRTLWNNLVVGNRTSTLNSEEFKRLTPKEQMGGTCKFQYKDVAQIEVIATNNVKIVADTEEQLRTAESALKAICEAKGCSLADLS